ncbi:bacterial type II secretion system F domain protein, partial [Vibrio parahaemolyticus V-223/04]
TSTLTWPCPHLLVC